MAPFAARMVEHPGPSSAQNGASQARPRPKTVAPGRQSGADAGAPEFPDGQTGHRMDPTMGLYPLGVRVYFAILSAGNTNARAGRIPHMDAIANVSAAPQRASTNASSTEIASQLSAAAIDADAGIAKQMLATLLGCQFPRSDD